jgi:hypothetical protein
MVRKHDTVQRGDDVDQRIDDIEEEKGRRQRQLG